MSFSYAGGDGFDFPLECCSAGIDTVHAKRRATNGSRRARLRVAKKPAISEASKENYGTVRSVTI